MKRHNCKDNYNGKMWLHLKKTCQSRCNYIHGSCVNTEVKKIWFFIIYHSLFKAYFQYLYYVSPFPDDPVFIIIMRFDQMYMCYWCSYLIWRNSATQRKFNFKYWLLLTFAWICKTLCGIIGLRTVWNGRIGGIKKFAQTLLETWAWFQIRARGS